MKKLIITLLLLFLGFQPAFSQNAFFEGLANFLNIAENIEKLINSYRNVDNQINEEKIKNMKTDLHVSVSDIIVKKRSILSDLEADSFNEEAYGNHISDLQKSMSELQETLEKYRPLIMAAGVNASDLRSQLNQNFLDKSKKLDHAKGIMSGELSDEKVVENLIVYFKACIQILEGAQEALQEGSP